MKIKFYNKNKALKFDGFVYTTDLGKIPSTEVLGENNNTIEINELFIDKLLVNRLAEKDKYVWEWNDKKMKFGIQKDVLHILGDYAYCITADELDGMGQFEAKERLKELRDMEKLGAILDFSVSKA